MPIFQVSYLLHKSEEESRIRSFHIECESMSTEKVFQELASRLSRNKKEENQIISQLKFSGMASIGKGRGIKNVCIVETATPLPFPD